MATALIANEDALSDTEASSDGEEENDKCGSGETIALRQLIGAGLMVVVVIAFAAFKDHNELTKEQYSTCFILSSVVVAWVTELLPIPITSILIGPLFFLFGVCSMKEAFSSYFGNLTMLLFGSFFIAIAMERHGLDTQFATFVTSLRIVRGEPWRLRAALMTTGAVMSMWISNTAATNILVPILLQSMNAERGVPLTDPTDQRTLTGSLLSLAYACNAGGMGTLVGTAPNMVTVNFLAANGGVDIGFLQWMIVGMPMAIVISLLCGVVLSFLFPPVGPTDAGKEVEDQGASREKAISSTSKRDVGFGAKKVPKMAWGGKVVLASFILVIFLWLFPAFYRLLGGQHHVLVKKSMPAGIMVLLGVAPMFAIPDTDGKTRVLPMSAAKKADWGIVMLVGGGLLLGKELVATGLGDLLAKAFLEATGVNDVWTLTFIMVFFTIFTTEITSNTATTNVLVPIVFGACKIINPDPQAAVAPCIGVAIAASCAFMMPIATPPNYLVKDTGHVRFGDMAKAGLVINLLASIVVWMMLRAIIPIGWPVA